VVALEKTTLYKKRLLYKVRTERPHVRFAPVTDGKPTAILDPMYGPAVRSNAAVRKNARHCANY
jgi:hypothetical protein